MAKRESIGIDMDEVLADTMGAILTAFNARTGMNVTIADIEGTRLQSMVPEHAKIVGEIITEEGFFRNIPLMADAIDVVKKLAAHYDIYIVTAAMDVPTSFKEKYDWLIEHFGFLDPQHFVFCGRKNIVATDYLIDDNQKQLAIHTGTPLMFTAPKNYGLTTFKRLDNWKDVETYFLGNKEA